MNSLPEELMNTRLTEGALEKSEFHFASIDGSHSRVAKSTNTQRGLQIHLSPSLGPQPANKWTANHQSTKIVIKIIIRDFAWVLTPTSSSYISQPSLSSHPSNHFYQMHLLKERYGDLLRVTTSFWIMWMSSLQTGGAFIRLVTQC